MSIGVSAGDPAEALTAEGRARASEIIQEDYENHSGVSGLHFIVFPVECTDLNKWRIYDGTIVYDTDVTDESFSAHTRKSDNFYRAKKWTLGEGELRHGSNWTTVSKPHAAHERILFVRQQDSHPYVEVERRNIQVPWVDIDITPFLNEFAQTQCRLTSHYRHTPSRDCQKLKHAVGLLRSALRKCCFESTVRGLYDLSGCYKRGLGVNKEFGTAKLLRRCADSMRRNYGLRTIWLKRLALEVDSLVPFERKIIVLSLLSRQTLTCLSVRRQIVQGPHRAVGPNTPIPMQRIGEVWSSSSDLDPFSGTKRNLWYINRQAAYCGQRVSIDILDVLLRHGDEGVAKVVAGAVKLYQQAADLGHAGDVNTRVISVGVAVHCMVMMEDRERVACGCRDGSVVIVNLRRTEIEKSWKAHDSDVNDIAIGRNGTRLVSVSRDKSAKLWDVESDRCVTMFKGHTDSVNCVAMMTDRKHMVTGSDDGTAQVWDMDTEQAVSKPFIGHEWSVKCVAVLRDGEHVVTGGEDEKLRMWSRSSGAQVGEPFFGHEDQVTCVDVTPDGKRIVSGSNDNTVRIWDATCREQIGESLSGHTDWVKSVAVSRDGTRIVSCSVDNTIRLWDIESGEEVCDSLEGHTDWVTGVLFLAGRDSIVSCSWDESMRFWDVERKSTGRVVDRHEGGVWSVTFTPDGNRVVSGSDDKTLRIWDVKSGEQIGDPLRGHSHWVTGVAVMPDGHHAVSVSHDKTMRVWDLQSRELLCTLTGHTASINCVAVTRNAEYAVTGSLDNTVRVWDMRAMDGIHVVLEGHGAPVMREFVSDDGKRVISVDHEDNAFVWDLETRQRVKQVSNENAWRLSRKQVLDLVGESTVHDNAGLSILLGQRKIKYGDGENTEVLSTLESNIWSWALSLDGKTICVGLDNGEVRFIKLER